LLDRLIAIARWVRNGYNLQPTHFVIAAEVALLRPACPGAGADRRMTSTAAWRMQDAGSADRRRRP
jgi:hypothetical protein